jgi:hypothetical protein
VIPNKELRAAYDRAVDRLRGSRRQTAALVAFRAALVKLVRHGWTAFNPHALTPAGVRLKRPLKGGGFAYVFLAHDGTVRKGL